MEEENDSGQISCSDQRSYIKIETLRGKPPTEIPNALHKVCGDCVVDRSTVSRWSSRFCEGHVSIQDDSRSERPVTVVRVVRRINNEGVLTEIQDLPKRWTAVIKHNGYYIEGL
jgi:uncharacterized protein CbrC (UPF0167 family)